MLSKLRKTGEALRKRKSVSSRGSNKTGGRNDPDELLVLEHALNSQADEDSLDEMRGQPKVYVDDGSKPLTQGEVAFLSKTTRQYAQRYADDEGPRVTNRQGVVLFVDISGFARMGIALRDKLSPTTAVEDFSRETVQIINAWTDICARYGGDVVKYAGDALLCTWLVPSEEDIREVEKARSKAKHFAQSEGRHVDLDWEANATLEQLTRLANRAALEMLLQSKSNSGKYNMHGGIGVGSLQEIFLCDGSGGLRWHLATGQAVDDATALMEGSPRGEIAVASDDAYRHNGLSWSITSRSKPTKDVTHFAQGPDDYMSLRPQSFMPMFFGGSSPLAPPALPARVRGTTGRARHIPKEINATLAQHRAAAVSAAVAAAVQRGPGLEPRAVRAFIPLSLRGRINRYAFQGGELRWCATMFVSIPNVKIGPERDAMGELVGLEDFNDTFLLVSRLIHSSNGEVRDLLFDDKGCIFIAVFGAYRRLENSELWLMRAAKAIRRHISDCSIGAAAGMCYAGLCGTSRRYDFVVMGYTVNLASRLMGGALERDGGIVVDQAIRDQTARYYKFDDYLVEKRKQTYTEKYRGYILTGRRAVERRGTLTELAGTTQVGRSVCEQLVQTFLTAIDARPASLALITIEGGPGMGKTTMANWMRRTLTFPKLFAQADAGTMDEPFAAFRQLFERAFGIRRDMDFAKVLAPRLEEIEATYGIDHERLALLLPYLNQRPASGSEAGASVAGAGGKLRRTSSMASFSSLHSNNIDVDEIQRVVYDLLLDVFRVQRGEDSTLVVILEDAVWLDPASQRLLLEMCSRKDDFAGVVLVTTFRSDYESDTAAEDWQPCIAQMRKSVGRQTRIVLEPLSRDATKKLISDTLTKCGVGALAQRTSILRPSIRRASTRRASGDPSIERSVFNIDSKVTDLVYRKTEGNPGAIVDKTRMMHDKRYVKLSKEGNVVFGSESRRLLAEQDSPKSVLELFLDRFDKLDEEEQAVLKVAACIGTVEFDSKVVRRVFEFEARSDPRRALNKQQIEVVLQVLATKGFLQHKEEARSRKSKRRMWEFVSTSVIQAVQCIVPHDRQQEIKQLVENNARTDLPYDPIERLDAVGLA